MCVTPVLPCSYFVSAKTGDNVAASFYRIVADISGVVLTSPDVNRATKVVTAQVIEHSHRARPGQDNMGGSTSSDMIKVKSKCSIM